MSLRMVGGNSAASRTMLFATHQRISTVISTTANQQFPFQRSISSSTQPVTEDNHPRFYPAYVHHVSKTVLEHLQGARSDWLTEQGLDRGLRLNSNGTFVLQFPAKRGFDSGRIWTSYDTSTKQHWLSVYRQKFVGRFLLKEKSSQKPQSFAGSTDARCRVKSVVDQMIATLESNRARRHGDGTNL